MGIFDLFRRKPEPLRTRALDAAGYGRRWPVGAQITSLNGDMAGGNVTIQRRASYFSRNNAHAAAAVNALVSNIIGPGIKPVQPASR